MQQSNWDWKHGVLTLVGIALGVLSAVYMPGAKDAICNAPSISLPAAQSAPASPAK